LNFCYLNLGKSNRLLSAQPKSDRIFITFSLSRSDRPLQQNRRDRLLSIQPKALAFSSRSAQVKMSANPSQSNTIAFTVMGKSDRQPKPNACDRFPSFQLAQISL
jgi:hypothetical protein